MIILTTIATTLVLRWARTRDRPPSPELPPLEYCRAELIRVNRQIHVFRNSSWWYGFPFVLGCAVLFYGGMEPIGLAPLTFYGFLAALYVCFLAAGYIIYGINIKAAEKQHIPIRDELVELINALSESSDVAS